MRSIAGLLLALVASIAYAQVTYTWTDITPANGTVAEVGTHVLDRNRLVIRGSFGNVPRSGTMYSDDAGRSWHTPASPVPPGNILFVDLARPDVVFLEKSSTIGIISAMAFVPPEAGNLYRSDDFGRTWSSVRTIPIGQTFDVFAKDPLDVRGMYGFYVETFRTSAPGFPVEARNPGLIRSHNDGVDWSAPHLLPGSFRAAFTGPTPSAPTRLFMSIFSGNYVSDDGGATWSPFRGPSVTRLSSVRADPHHPDILYGFLSETEHNVLLRSDDGGASWKTLFFSLTTLPVLTIDPARPNVLWITHKDQAIYRSADRGASWQEIPLPFRDTLPAPGSFATIVTSPAEAGVVYFVWGNRLYRGVPSAAPDPVVAEFEYEGDRYWLTSLDGEAVSQDYRQEPGHVHRTGLRWGAWNAADAPAGAVGSCRFWPKPQIGRTRVVVQQGSDCEALRHDPGWILEAENEFYTLRPVNDTCPAGTVPVRRFLNLKADFNHRWVADAAAQADMRARGWYDEGVRFCARPLGSNE